MSFQRAAPMLCAIVASGALAGCGLGGNAATSTAFPKVDTTFMRLGPAVARRFQALVPKHATVESAVCQQSEARPSLYDCSIFMLEDRPDGMIDYAVRVLPHGRFVAHSGIGNGGDRWPPPRSFRGRY